ncbi:MAG: SRPBCC family protein [Spirochaetes bacterium]|nr:SRPBCC family protein [Spirochaetota bacterium]
MLKKMMWALLGLVALALVVAGVGPLFLPKSYSVSRSLDLAAPVAKVYAAVGDFQKFNLWQPWIRYEPSASQTVSGKPFTVGARYAWEGKRIGSGSMTIREIKENALVVHDLEFTSPQASKAVSRFDMKDLGGATRITWTLTGESAYLGRWFGLMMDRMMGNDFESGLQNLKAFAEK